MGSLAATIASLKVEPGSLAIFWLGQPATFLSACKEFAPQTIPLILMVSEPYIFKKE